MNKEQALKIISEAGMKAVKKVQNKRWIFFEDRYSLADGSVCCAPEEVFDLIPDDMYDEYDYYSDGIVPTGDKVLVACNDESVSVYDWNLFLEKAKIEFAKYKSMPVDNAYIDDDVTGYFVYEEEEPLETFEDYMKWVMDTIEDSYVNGDSDEGMVIYNIKTGDNSDGGCSVSELSREDVIEMVKEYKENSEDGEDEDGEDDEDDE